ncbi:MAG: zinc ribbon domain-containing protein [Planctomycetaceae bacterium]|nr:zinc ribbon domain-containing protein [Planctomycetaceae bacterium]
MPTYEYECEACGHAFEEFQSMSAKPLKKCPQCAKNKLIRLIGSGAGIIFKGSGFYETDYKRKDQPKPAESKPSASTSSDKPAASKSEGSSSTSGGESKTAKAS